MHSPSSLSYHTLETEAEKNYILPEKAKEIALQHANINAKQIENIKISYRFSGKSTEFIVVFELNTVEYSYTINAQTGEILYSYIEEHRNIKDTTMSKSLDTYYCEDCKKEAFLTKGQKKQCPLCNKNLIPLETNKEEFEAYTKEEQDIIIESNLLRERKKQEKMQYKIDNPYADTSEELRKIANDVATTKWLVIGFGALAFFVYLMEEFL